MAHASLHHLIQKLHELTSEGKVQWTHLPDGVFEVRVDPLAVLLESKTKNFVFQGPLGLELDSFSFKSLKEAAGRGESRYCKVCEQLLELASKDQTKLNRSRTLASSSKVTNPRKTKLTKTASAKDTDVETIDVKKAVRDLANKINEPSEDTGIV